MTTGAFARQNGEYLVNSTVNGVQTDSAITALADGGYVITWTDNSASGPDTSGASIRGQRFDANGAKVGGEFLVNATTTNAQTESSVVALPSGGFVVSWTDASLQGGDADGLSVKMRIFDANGVPVTGDTLVNTTTKLNQSTSTITALASGGFVVSWADGSGTGPDNKGVGVKAQIYSASGAKIGGEFLVNTTILNSQNAPSITGLASGGFVATWTDSSGQGGDPTAPSVKGQMFSATGVKIGGEFLINTAVAGSQDQPVIAALSNGGFVAVWRDTSGQGDTSGSGVKAQIFNASGAKVGGELLVNTAMLNTQDQPAVTAIPGGGFAVSWHDNSILAGDPSGFAIKTQVFDNLGNRLGGEFLVNTATNGNQEMPAITALASGALVMSWTDYSGQGGDTDGGIKSQIFQPVTGTITDLTLSASQVSEAAVQNAPIASLGANGALNATYTYQIISDSTGGAFGIDGGNLVVKDSLALDYETSSSATLAIRVTDGFGNSLDKTFTLGITDSVVENRYSGGSELLANSATLNNQQAPAITTLANGNYVVSWADGSAQGGDTSGYGIKAQVFDASGAKIGGEFLVNTQTLGSQSDTAVTALASGGFVVTWTDASATGPDASSSGIKAQLFSSSGAAIGSEFLVNTTTLNAQRIPTVAALSSGGFVITWADTSLQGGDASVSSVKAQIFDASGAKVGGEFLVNTNTANAQDTAVVAGLTSGGFVISWHDSSATLGDSSKDSVKAQIFDASGAKVGGEFLVNTETLSNQQQETITGLGNGGFVIAWADGSNHGDPDNFGIKLQVFDASGAKVGGEILANTTTQGPQIQPHVEALQGGGFIVSWGDYSGAGPEAGTAGVKAQIFTDSGAKVGGEFIVNSQAQGTQSDPAIAHGADGGFAAVWADASGLGGDPSGTSIKMKVFTPLPDQGGPPPLIAGADTVAGTEDQTLLIAPATLLANDVSAAGLPLSIESVASLSGGSVSILADGTIAFTPTANFAGAAQFTYVATDGVNDATGHVVVNVANVNDPPLAVADAVNVLEDGNTIAASVLLANDQDIDPGDHLSIIGTSATSSAGAALSITGGNIVYAPGSLFQSLAAGQTATDSFTYTISDIAGATSSATVSLTVIGANDAPTNLALSNASVDENAANGTLIGTFTASDVDQGDTLTYSLTNNAGGRFAIDATTGALTVANGALLDYEKGTSYTIATHAVDSGGLAVDGSFTISLNNLPEPKSWTGDNGVNVFTASTNDFWTINGLGGNDVLTGNASADTINGGAGNDTLDGAGGADTLIGGIGNDIFFVDNAGDQVVENAGEGTDQVNASIDYTMTANVENLTQTGTAGIAATGNSLANTITGNAGDNVMHGGQGGDLLTGNEGNDTLWGEDGADFLLGNDGNDVLIGGAGADELTGGAGNDRFVFDALTTSADRDKVKDFVHGEDIFAMASTIFTALAAGPGGTLSASQFGVGTQATTASQRIIYTSSNGNLYYDPDGTGAAAQVQIALLSTKPTLNNTDFTIF
jgi:VCBS repeat-containing protein